MDANRICICTAVISRRLSAGAPRQIDDKSGALQGHRVMCHMD